jgi:hypothetical protein
VISVVFLALRWFLRRPPEIIAGYIRRIIYLTVGFLLLYLAVTGKLNWLFALLGVLVAILARMLPVLLRFSPELQKLWHLFIASRRGTSRPFEKPQSSGKMSVAEAYEVLGLKPGASKKEITDAHRKLMQKNHPDRGGNNYFATKLNKAKQTLINNQD